MKRLAVFCLLLAGCASAPAVQTFSQIAVDTESVADAVVVASTTALKAGIITSAQAQKILGFTDAITAAVTAANAAFAAGNTALANSTLSAATATLTSVQACTTGPAAQLTACLAPIPNP